MVIKSRIPRYVGKGYYIYETRYYHGRFECSLWGRSRAEMLTWIRSTFADDDMVYTNSEIDSNVEDNCDALLTKEQVFMFLLRFK